MRRPLPSRSQTPSSETTWPAAEQAAVLRDLLGSPSWCVDTFQLTDEQLRIGGWALPLDSGSPTTITLNGIAMEPISWGRPRPDLERLCWHWPGSGTSGFELCVAVNHRTLFANGRLELAYTHADSLLPVDKRHLVYFPSANQSHTVLPDHARQARVQGIGNDATFVREGFSAFEKIMSTLERHSARSRHKMGSLLDWGCGCGRVSRYLEASETCVTGIDIDADNAAWCASHLAFGRFLAVPLRPPCPSLEARSFDAVMGMSVMTHLTEVDQHRWLEELHRITRPGALLALTAHGGPAIARAGLPANLLRRWLDTGFLDAGMNPDLATSIDEPSFYRNSFHSADYVRRNWTRYFDIVEHVQGFVGNHHDLVVLRRRQ
jgi:SAM-dependent methyltransferase